VLISQTYDNPKVIYANTVIYDLRTSKKTVIKSNINVIKFKMPFCPEAMLLRTDILRKCGGYNEQKKVAGDYYLFLKIYRDYGIESFKYVNREILTYRTHGLSYRFAQLGYYECMITKMELGYGTFVPLIFFIYFYTGAFLRKF
jgi:hypothetical protein